MGVVWLLNREEERREVRAPWELIRTQATASTPTETDQTREWQFDPDAFENPINMGISMGINAPEALVKYGLVVSVRRTF